MSTELFLNLPDDSLDDEMKKATGPILVDRWAADASTEPALATPVLDDGGRLRPYLFWAWWVGVAFFAVYPTMNWITSLRSGPMHLYLPVELAVPLVPQFIWAYLSMYLFFFMPPLFLPATHMPALGKRWRACPWAATSRSK